MRTKYPRTFHLPWSLGATDDDKTHSDAAVEAMFGGREVVITEKMDGENTTIYPDGYTHARSVDSAHHPSRAWVKALASQAGHDLPSNWRICGENLFAKHSVGYEKLPSYFLAFSIWVKDFDGLVGDSCLSWDETEEWCKLLGVDLVPVLYRGPWDAGVAKDLWPLPSRFGSEAEGYVVRLAGSFKLSEFARSVAKFVRKDHVQTDQHWMHAEIVPNGVSRGEESP